MEGVSWPIEQMAAILGGRLTTSGSNQSIRWQSGELGIKLKLGVDTEGDTIRLVVDRLSKRRPTFVGTLVLDQVAGVELDEEDGEVRICTGGGLQMAITRDCTVQLYRPV